MPLSLLTNISSLTAQRNVGKSQQLLQTSIERLSSGQRINRAYDDPAGLAISSNLTAVLGGLQQAGRNSQDAISLVQTADASLGQLNQIMARMRVLAVQSANGGTLSNSNRASVDQEYQALFSEIDRIVAVTQYNGQPLINGAFSAGASFQVGAFNTVNDIIAINIAQAGTSVNAFNLTGTAVNTIANAQGAIQRLDSAVQLLASNRAILGAAQSRLGNTIDNLSTQYINLAAANSRILDADIASETSTLARTQILLQAGVTVLAQANNQPQIALSLLGN